jgi:hypothetical protein
MGRQKEKVKRQNQKCRGEGRWVRGGKIKQQHLV